MFGTSGVRGPVGETVTASLALDIGRAVASEVGEEDADGGGATVVVGRDARETSPVLADAASAGLRECGADAVRVGVASTPTVARSAGWYDADAAVVVTASHNPPADNGLKLWTARGRAFPTDRRRAVARRVEEESFAFAAWDAHGEERTATDAERRHLDRLTGAVGSLDGLSAVVDVGNGAGGVTADALRAAGCDVTTLNARPDGRFPSRPSEPTAENCGRLAETVAATDADFGVAHDGDADRMMAVDETGAFVGDDALLAAFARDGVSAGGRVVVPVNASLAVDDEVRAAGGEVLRTPVGDVHVAERAAEEGAAFGGEPSGAWIWPEETLCPDGPLAACRLAELVAERGPLSELVAGVESYPIRRRAVEADDPDRAMQAVEGRVRESFADVNTVDGVRVELDDGWFLVRASGTQPLVRVTAEARTERRADAVLERALTVAREAVKSTA